MRRLPTVLVYSLSAVILAAIVIATAAVGVGVRTTYGSGIDSRLGSQVGRDFLTDQNAEARALSTGDPSAASGRLTGNAIQDVGQQISRQSIAGRAPTVTLQPDSLTILRAQDPSDPSLIIKVVEDGTKTVTSDGGPASVPTQQTISFHGEFWLRQEVANSGPYLIADQNIQNLPASYLPSIGLAAVALAWVAVAAFLVLRLRAQTVSEIKAVGLADAVGAVLNAPDAYEPVLEYEADAVAEPAPKEAARILIRTFGGLRLHQDGQEWAGALNARQVTGFIWLRLLLAAIADGNGRLTRDELGRQASPTYDHENQLKRMRNVVYQGLRDLPAALRDRIRVEPQVMSFNLDECEVDAVELLEAQAECAGRTVLSSQQIARAQRAIAASAGTFLPEFESLEDIATLSHPTCTELIRQQRELLAAKRSELITKLAGQDSRTAAAVVSGRRS